MSPRLAWVGMGNMGKAMSRNLALKGNLDQPLLLWTRSTANAEAHAAELGSSKGIVANSLPDAVREADMIWSCLTDLHAVTEIFDTILKETDVQGKLIVECSTVPSEASEELCARVLAAGAEFVSMPVFGEPSMATAGVLTCVPAGKRESVDKVKPFLVSVVGKAVIDYSDVAVGKASLLKVVGNTFIISMIQALPEGHVLAEKTGLGSDNLEKFLSIVFPQPYMIHSKRISSGDYHKTEPIVSIGMAQTVADHVAKKRMDAIEKHAGKNGDIDGLYGAVRMESGLPYEN